MFIGGKTKARLIRDMDQAWNAIESLKYRVSQLEDRQPESSTVDWPPTAGPWMADYAGQREVVFAYEEERGMAIQCKDACFYLVGNPGSPTNFAPVTVDED